MRCNPDKETSVPIKYETVCTTDLVCALWEKKRKEKKSVTAL
jgi:hypothetical protein